MIESAGGQGLDYARSSEQLALMMLKEAGYSGMVATSLPMLCEALEHGAGLLIIAAEALRGADLEPLLEHLHQQPAWSDLPIVLMTHHGGGEQNGDGGEAGESTHAGRIPGEG